MHFIWCFLKPCFLCMKKSSMSIPLSILYRVNSSWMWENNEIISFFFFFNSSAFVQRVVLFMQVECSTFQIFPSHAHSPALFSTVFNLVIPLSLCLIPIFSQYHLNDSCKPLRIFSCEWWGFLLKEEKRGDSLSGDIHLISHSVFSFLLSHSHTHSLLYHFAV